MDTDTLLFEAAVSADEEEADFIPVGFTDGAGRRLTRTLFPNWLYGWGRGGYYNRWLFFVTLTDDDEFVIVDLVEDADVLLAESSAI